MSWQHYLLGNKGAHVYTGNQFQCVHCRRSYQSYRTLGNHKCAYCPTCKKIFSTYQKFQIHKTSTCTQDDSQPSRKSKLSSSHTPDTELENSTLSAPEQTTSVSRTSKDVAVIRASKDTAALVGDGTTEVPDYVVCSALHLMRENNTLCGIQYMGYYTPAEMKLALTSKDTTLHKPIVPPDQLCINIHHIPGHWVTSCQQPNHGINVYDSLMSQKHFVDVLLHNCKSYTDRNVSPE